MERLQLLIICLFVSLSSFAQLNIQTVTADATVSNTTDVLVNTGTNTNLILPVSPATGKILHVINHGTGDLLFNLPIKVSKNNTFDFLPSSPSEYRPFISTNHIKILWNGTNWLLL